MGNARTKLPKTGRNPLALALASLAFAACGAPASLNEAGSLSFYDDARPMSVSAAVAPVGFREWCGILGIGGCENFRSGGLPEAYRVNAGMTILSNILNSGSDIAITRGELDDSSLAAGMRLLGKEETLRAFLRRLDEGKFSGLRLRGDGRISLSSGDANEARSAASGVLRRLETLSTLGLSFDTGLHGVTQGFRIGGATSGTTQELRSFRLAGDAFELNTNTHKVQGVPSSFMLEEVLGAPALESPARLSAPQVLQALPHLKNWLVRGQRDLVLNQNVMNALASDLPTLIESADRAKLARDVFTRVSGLVSTRANRGRTLLQVTLRRPLKCYNPVDKIEFNMPSQFGIHDFRPIAGGGLEISFYGIKVTAIMRFKNISFDLSKVEVYADRSIVRGVPLLGSMTIPGALSLPQLDCSK